MSLLLASWVLSGLELTARAAVVVAAVVAVADVVLRPGLRLLVSRAGAVGALVLGILAQLLVVGVALSVTPGVRSGSVATVALALVLVALFSTVDRFLLGAGDKAYLVGDLVRRGERRRRRAGDAGDRPGGPPGLVVVQIDGLPFPVLMHGVSSGNLPTLSRWVRSGSHTAAEWWARVPCTTPASQAGLLHGTNDEIPAFRWYEKVSGRLLVANRPADAAEIERRVSDGRGLLADGGVSVSNLFSGDAPTNLMVMSHARQQGGLGPGADYLRFCASPFVFVRALLLTIGEMVKEVYQARR